MMNCADISTIATTASIGTSLTGTTSMGTLNIDTLSKTDVKDAIKEYFEEKEKIKMKFKIGDKIIGNKKANMYGITREGWIGYVTYVLPDGDIKVDDTKRNDEGGMTVESSCFDLYKEGVVTKEIKITEKIKIEKIIFNKPATILYANGKRYVSKAYNEEFDEEKGLLMCLIKAFGISHLELQRMIKGATTQTKKEATKNTKEEVKKEPVIESPKGRHRGKHYTFNIDDKVVIRDCDQYEYTTNATARKMLNRVWRVQDVDDFDTVIVNGVEFSKCEVEKLKF